MRAPVVKHMKAVGKFALILGVILVLALVFLRIFVSYVNYYKAYFEQEAGQSLQQPLEIGKIEVNWQGLFPVFNVDNIVIYDRAKQLKLIQVQRLQITPDIWASIHHGRLITSQLHLTGAKFTIHQYPDNVWDVNGIKRKIISKDTARNTLQTILNWLHDHGQISTDHIDLDLHYIDGSTFSITGLKLVSIPQPNLLKISANTDNFAVLSDKFFEQQLTFSSLGFSLKYHFNDSGWGISINDINLMNNEIQAHGQITIVPERQKKSGDFLQLTASISGNNITRLPHYIPKGVLKEKLANWLRIALIRGSGFQGKFSLKRPLNDLADTDHLDGFKAALHVKDVELNYRPGWPHLTNMDADLLFDRKGLKFEVTQAKIANIQTNSIHGDIPDLNRPILHINWNSQARYRDLSRIIFASPLNKTIGKTLKYLEYTGPSQLQLNLEIPLFKGNDKNVRVEGSYILFHSGTLKIPSNNITLTQLQGSLQFTSDSLSSQNLRGLWLGQPIAIQIVTEQKDRKSPKINVAATGTLVVEDLVKAYHLSFLSKFISGKTFFKALLKFSNVNNQIHNLFSFYSDLFGISIYLPEPLKKSAEDRRPTNIQLEVKENSRLLNITYARKFLARVDMEKNHNSSWNTFKGKIQFDKRKMLVYAKQLTNCWKIKISGRTVSGSLIIPHNLTAQPIQGVFERFDLTSAFIKSISTAFSAQKNSKETTTVNPGSIPSLAFLFKNFYYDTYPLGKICIITKRQKDSMQIKNFSVTFPYFDLHAIGQWGYREGRHQTLFSGGIITSDLGSVLKNWHITQSIQGAKGHASFTIGWEGPVYDPVVSKLNGSFAIKLEQGKILKVIANNDYTPTGLILNVITFSVLEQILSPAKIKGKRNFNFDSLKANFFIINGNAFTSDIFLEGELARVQSAGRIGLAAEDFDLLVKITPYVTQNIVPGSSLIIVGYVMRAGLKVVNKLIGGVLNRFFIKNYHITGSWWQPSFQKI